MTQEDLCHSQSLRFLQDLVIINDTNENYEWNLTTLLSIKSRFGPFPSHKQSLSRTALLKTESINKHIYNRLTDERAIDFSVSASQALYSQINTKY